MGVIMNLDEYPDDVVKLARSWAVTISDDPSDLSKIMNAICGAVVAERAMQEERTSSIYGGLSDNIMAFVQYQNSDGGIAYNPRVDVNEILKVIRKHRTALQTQDQSDKGGMRE